MKKNLSDYLVALAVIVCSLVLLAALTIALSGYRLKKPSRTLEIDYADVSGIHLASDLRYAGAPAGHVMTIRLLTPEERNADANLSKIGTDNAVRVTVEVNDNVPPLRVDVRASLDADTLLSEKFVSLTAGKTGSDLLPNGTVLQGYPGGLDALLKGNGINELLASVQSNLIPKLDTVLDSAQKAVTDGDALLKNVDNLVNEKGSLRLTINAAHDAVAKIQGVEATLDDVLKKAGALVTDTGTNLDGRMKELSVVLANLKVATTYLKSFTKQLGEKPNRVIFSGKAEKLTPEEQIIKSQKPVPATPPTPTPAQ